MSSVFEEIKMEGIQEGERQRALVIVKNLLADGTLSVEKITEISGLSYEEVEQIAGSF